MEAVHGWVWIFSGITHLNSVQLELRSASESVLLVEIIWVGLYLN